MNDWIFTRTDKIGNDCLGEKKVGGAVIGVA